MNKKLYVSNVLLYLGIVILSLVVFNSFKINTNFTYALILLIPLIIFGKVFNKKIDNRFYILFLVVQIIHLAILIRTLLDPGFISSNVLYTSSVSGQLIDTNLNMTRVSYLLQNRLFLSLMYITLYIYTAIEIKPKINLKNTFLIILLFMHVIFGLGGFNVSLFMELLFLIIEIFILYKDKKFTFLLILNLIFNEIAIITSILM